MAQPSHWLAGSLALAVLGALLALLQPSTDPEFETGLEDIETFLMDIQDRIETDPGCLETNTSCEDKK